MSLVTSVSYRWRVVSSVAQLVPGLQTFRHYDRAHLRGDVIGGVTLVAYLVPQVMAYTALAGLPPQIGLWAVVVAMTVYALFGTSRLLSVGPESTTALLTAATLGPLAAGDPIRYASLAALLALMVGVLALVAWAVRAGVIADLLSRPVLVGYMAGIAVIMIVSQIERLTGVDSAGDTLLQQIQSWFSADWSMINVPDATLGVIVAVLLLVLAPRLPRVPVVLVVVLLAAVATVLVERAGIDITTIGRVPSDLPSLGWSSLSLSDVRSLILPALGVLVVAYADNMLTARAFSRHNGHRVDNNQELLALGLANVAVSAVRGYPVSSSASRVAVAEAAGARTQLHTLVASAAVIAVLLVFGGVLAAFPVAALGGVVIYAATRLVDLGEFRRLLHFRLREFLLAVSATLGVLLVDVLYGILIAVGLSVVDLLLRVARPHAAVLGQPAGVPGWHDVGDYPHARQIPGLVVFRYDSPLFFADAEDFQRRAWQAVQDSEPAARWLLLNVEGIIEVDLTGLDALRALVDRCRRHDVVLAVVRAKSELVTEMERHGVAREIGLDRFYPTLPTAVAAFETWVREQPNGGPGDADSDSMEP